MDLSNKNKKSDVVLKAFKTLMKDVVKVPRSVLMVVGGEFARVRKWCTESGIKAYLPYSSFHGSFIEIFNLSIKNRICNWMDANKTEKYLYSDQHVDEYEMNFLLKKIKNYQKILVVIYLEILLP